MAVQTAVFAIEGAVRTESGSRRPVMICRAQRAGDIHDEDGRALAQRRRDSFAPARRRYCHGERDKEGKQGTGELRHQLTYENQRGRQAMVQRNSRLAVASL